MSNRASPDLTASWKTTLGHLAEARSALPPVPDSGLEGATLESYDHFLSNNELELALEELVDLGMSNHPPKCFWRGLALAARNMGLAERAQVLEILAAGEV